MQRRARGQRVCRSAAPTRAARAARRCGAPSACAPRGEESGRRPALQEDHDADQDGHLAKPRRERGGIDAHVESASQARPGWWHASFPKPPHHTTEGVERCSSGRARGPHSCDLRERRPPTDGKAGTEPEGSPRPRRPPARTPRPRTKFPQASGFTARMAEPAVGAEEQTVHARTLTDARA